ncbi:MAG: ubiquinone biosynthesis regulatory protein kinase UbiB [Gammaproteobacteria bacterium]
MAKVRLALRLLTIQRTLIKHGLDDVVWATHLFRPIARMRRLGQRRAGRRAGLGVRIRLALEELGPIFVKFGQALSTRRDVLPLDIADELAKLQDRVPPFSSEEAVAILERAFGESVEVIYGEFEKKPLAAASVAQVHAARLKTGEAVVVKVLRPGVRRKIRRDLEVLYALANMAERFWPVARQLRPVDIIAEFEKTLLHELDLTREAANAAQLKRNFDNSDTLYIPDVYWDYCRPEVLTMERVSGVPISDIAALKEAGTNFQRLAENGVEIFFTQVFRHNFFHADMHPGNIFVDITNPDKPRYIAVDFGIVGTLSSSDQKYLAGNFLAFFQGDYRRVAKLHVDSGWVPGDTRIDELESAVRAVCEPIFNRPLKDISFGLILLRLFQTARQFEMEIQPQLVLLQKTLLNIEGLGRQLYPELDLWATAQPILEEWTKERTNPRAQLMRLLRSWPESSEDILALPGLLRGVLERASEDAPKTPGRTPHRGARFAASHVARRTMHGAALLIAGVLWAGLAISPVWVGFSGAALGIVLMLWPRRKPQQRDQTI